MTIRCLGLPLALTFVAACIPPGEPKPGTTPNEPGSTRVGGKTPVFPDAQMDQIRFEDGTDRLRPESDVALALVADALAAHPEITLLRIENHTDTAGALGWTLTERRAMAVARWLADSAGVDCRRLIAIGFGDSQPSPAPLVRTRFQVVGRNGILVAGVTSADGGGRIAGDPCR